MSASAPRTIGVAVVGAGAWGRNLIRTFHGHPGSRLAAVVDVNGDRVAQVRSQIPGVLATTKLDLVLADPAIDAVVVATSPAAHEAIALRAIAAGKHVWVEKPLATSSAAARRVADAAKAAGRTLMTGHLLLYHPAVTYLRKLIDQGQLGEVYYMYSVRVNLGTVRQDENALWSFAPHDISMMNHLMAARPESVSARGQSYLQQGIEDVVFVSLRYPGGRMGHIHLSWLDPHKTRRLTIVGSNKMVVFDDTEPSEKVRIYDKGANLSREYTTFGEYLGLRSGDITIPSIDAREPLQVQCSRFLDAVRTGAPLLSDGHEGIAVTDVLEAATESLRADGAPVMLEEV